ncbi:TPA: Sec-independent protein translocase protein TatB [Yersinia enterocolitica]|uniref:Sec-independent protein translocase protein TatB n=2 Tax=Yersinia enterocolitica TaxID=630 RepID=A0A0H3NWT3_YERE1|nr:Sec-independent protein translocase protein TatB [Yersinia enterocolitica]EHB19420.1 Sec-independent protein translocase protein TatB [Yersinia enterocolitica subsp. palearctica PhRBD_Ye1]EKN3315752.1 Sec-independent protein translocase subunit TatB [Yersinia enterocolitica]EKN3319571.1 Sec-independent protein translocase subunit TatB [Yersinia enterocolitica]EKN3323577.1 Sec-independent protein translocase subunit TatB [Yersinia enterocolitica]EKN3335469.1 Sec-independent protein transloca
MFDIGFSELLLVLVIGLVVLGPERLPVAVRTVAGWIRTLRSLAATVQNELAQELKIQELQDSLKKSEEAGLQNLTPELKASMDELKEAAEALKRSYHSDIGSEAPHTIHNPLVTEPEAIHDGVTPAESATKAQASPQVPATDVDKAITPTAVETASNNNEKPIVQVETFSASISSVDREPVPVTSIPETKVQTATVDTHSTDSHGADQPRTHQPGGDR